MEGFLHSVFVEAGWLNSKAMKKEAIQAFLEQVKNNLEVPVLSLECIMLSPYAQHFRETRPSDF